MTTQNLCDAAKAVLRGKFIAIQLYLKKQEKHQIDNLASHLKQLEKEEEEEEINRRKTIIKITPEICEKKMKETIIKINKTKNWLFEKINKMTNLQQDSSRKKEKNQINKIRNEKREVTTDNAEIQKAIETLMNIYMAIE